MNIDPSTTKYLICAHITADGIVEKPDVVGAIFGQTEGLIGDELDLRDLQKSGRMGRIEVELTSQKGKSEGSITMPSSLDQVETAIIASALETIDRVGPCKAKIETLKVEDVRASKKAQIIERAKELLKEMVVASKSAGIDITETVRQAIQVEEIIHYGADKCPAGPNIDSSDSIIIVEGRSDVLNLLKFGIKNAIGVEGTNVPKTIQDLSKERVVTVFVDGDRGGELILRELLQVAEIDFVARAPKNREVEEMTQKQIIKALRNKIPAEQFFEMMGIEMGEKAGAAAHGKADHGHPHPAPAPAHVPGSAPPAAPAPSAGAAQPTAAPVAAGSDIQNDFEHVEGQDFGEKMGAERFAQKQLPKLPKKEKPKEFKEPSDKKLSPEQLKYRELLLSLSGSLKALLLNKQNQVIRELAVRELAETLKKAQKDVAIVVFDGVITQRLLEIIAERGIQTVVGVKFGNVTKQPANIRVYTKADLD